MRLTEIRIAGFGGQGVILSATVIGKALAIFEGGHATMTQNFGPEARGGAASAQLILSDTPVLYPYVTGLDFLVVMSQEAYTRFAPELKDTAEIAKRIRADINEALRMCPDLVPVHADMDMYGEICTRSLRVLTSFTDKVEPFSIDEAYIDITGSLKLFGGDETIARKIKTDILRGREALAKALQQGGLSHEKFEM